MKDCGKEKEIDMLNKAIHGNGRPGLIETTARMSEKVDNIEISMEAIRADLKVLLMFQTQIEANNAHKSTGKKDKMWMFTAILATVGLLANIIKDWLI